MILIETILFFHDIIRQDEKLLIRELNYAGASYRLINVDNYLFEFPGNAQLGLAFPRTISQHKTQLVAQLNEAVGNRSINSLRSIITGNNKAATMAALSRLNVPIPHSIIAHPSIATKNLELSYPLIVKPIQGSWGRMVGLAKDPRDLSLLIRHRAEAGNEAIILQEFIEKPGRDIRVTVVGGEAVAAIYRYSPGNDWRTNTARGGRAEAAKLDPELEELSIRSTNAINASYAGVDIVESRNGYRVLEVNVVPEFKNVMRVTGINVARRIVELLILNARRGG
ncbi:MAG: lysine biosynthesis protein LysX [Thermocladium sp.]